MNEDPVPHQDPHSPPTDLLILRSKTSDKLEVDPEYPHETALLTVIRLLYSCFIVLSFILFTSPRGQVINGVSLDATVNVTVLPPIHHHETSTPVSKPEKSFLNPTRLNRVNAVSPAPSFYHTGTYSNYYTSQHATAQNPSILAVPALFGKPMSKKKLVSPLVVLDVDACHPFSVTFPDASEWIHNTTHHMHQAPSPPSTTQSSDSWLLSFLKQWFPQDPSTSAISPLAPPPSHESDAPTPGNPWTALVARGNCPFDVKIMNTEAAGFGGIVIHNRVMRGSGVADVPVRMSPNKKGESVREIRAMFVTQFDGDKIVSAAIEHYNSLPDSTLTKLLASPLIKHLPNGGIIGSPLLITLTLDTWPVNGWGTTNTPTLHLKTHIVSVLTFLGNTLFFLGLFLALGGICTAESDEESIPLHHPAASPLSKDDQELDQITLRLHVIEAEDLEEEEQSTLAGPFTSSIVIKRKRAIVTGGTRRCCAICIDEFVVGSNARVLPCNHQFHTACVDPWLLGHNRLCPICKRDVLVVKKSEHERQQDEEVLATSSSGSDHAASSTVLSRFWSWSSRNA
ncbi:hypothetical protein HDU98_007946 [Podochytrium sp. JEL0797]|nr:hypothetical protein HDU98_007946 [Podochytrium sp. JEL0797]